MFFALPSMILGPKCAKMINDESNQSIKVSGFDCEKKLQVEIE
jgi:hypothetical protein